MALNTARPYFKDVTVKRSSAIEDLSFSFEGLLQSAKKETGLEEEGFLRDPLVVGIIEDGEEIKVYSVLRGLVLDETLPSSRVAKVYVTSLERLVKEMNRKGYSIRTHHFISSS